MIAASGTAVPDVLPELVALVGAAALIGYLSSRLRVVPIVGFLVAGVVVGPYQLGLVREQEVVDTVAEIGVILLLFTIGLEFSLERLNQIRRLIVVGGGLQVVLATGATAGTAYAFGVPWQDAVFSGLLVSLSSTAIVLKLLAERHEAGTPRGQAATAVLLFQDLAVVAMVLLVPILGASAAGGHGSGGGPGEIPLALGKAALLVVGVLVVARRLMPPLLDVVARTCSPEVFLLTIVAVCFGTALGSAALGVSLSLGAFLAGMVVSESRHGTHAFGEILPLQILFSATFFVSVGMLLDAGFLLERPLLVTGFVVGIVAVKALTGAAAVAAVGTGVPVALGAGLLLAQVGEFSFVLDQVGRDSGLSALGLGADGSQALIAATVVLMIATPALAAAGSRLEGRLGPRMAARRPLDLPAGAHDGRRGHALVLGYGTAAQAAVAELRRFGLPFTVLTLNPDAARAAAAEGMDVVVGDYAKRPVLLEAGAAAARIAIVADDEPERTHHVVRAVRALNVDAVVVTRPLGDPDVAELARAGADHVVTPERASGIGLAIAIRAALGGGDGTVPLSSVIHYRPAAAARCRHLGEIRPVQPSAYGCEECLRAGASWYHLRVCLTCGHVGCCDTSEHRHARAHAAAAAHPLVASLQPAEDWAYCFPDDETITPAGSPG